ncbi:uncharacterized protein B0I36DRAFT_328061 [Microdochium trichocladiopsis]|uniref:Secreted protein n=1 Tax=Microdochium trichocladiopsis TaxID=1682393 RepID=A0A9P9BL99_9PEZI|nr:uncharacterized protein B0I36DRAFT_328061 [Microdochium trichocladiopsis]KAH7027862.1 hypothetical protein B0I36DRAFT_328061 [Microdochium trichocladiopsis]
MYFEQRVVLPALLLFALVVFLLCCCGCCRCLCVVTSLADLAMSCGSDSRLSSCAGVVQPSLVVAVMMHGIVVKLESDCEWLSVSRSRVDGVR